MDTLTQNQLYFDPCAINVGQNQLYFDPSAINVGQNQLYFDDWWNHPESWGGQGDEHKYIPMYVMEQLDIYLPMPPPKINLVSYSGMPEPSLPEYYKPHTGIIKPIMSRFTDTTSTYMLPSIQIKWSKMTKTLLSSMRKKQKIIYLEKLRKKASKIMSILEPVVKIKKHGSKRTESDIDIHKPDLHDMSIAERVELYDAYYFPHDERRPGVINTDSIYYRGKCVIDSGLIFAKYKSTLYEFNAYSVYSYTREYSKIRNMVLFYDHKNVISIYNWIVYVVKDYSVDYDTLCFEYLMLTGYKLSEYFPKFCEIEEYFNESNIEVIGHYLQSPIIRKMHNLRYIKLADPSHPHKLTDKFIKMYENFYEDNKRGSIVKKKRKD